MQKITASFETLMNQAPMTSNTYMKQAIIMIDEQLGEGFAKKNPELIGQFMRTCATDNFTLTLSSVIQDLDKSINDLYKK
jgi:hypothetical protein